jgi:hypothetical protein
MAFGLSNSNDLVRPWSTQLGPAVSAGSLVHPVRVPIVTFLAEHGQEISATDPTLLPWQKVGQEVGLNSRFLLEVWISSPIVWVIFAHHGAYISKRIWWKSNPGA